MSLLPASHPVLSCAEAKAWESSRLKDEAAEWAAMQQAGAALAQALLGDCHEIGGLPGSAHVLVLAGKGHNGGDALLAAKAIYATHRRARIDVLLCFGAAALRPLAKRALAELRKTGGSRVRLADWPALKAELPDYDVCLDGVFGFQFRPPLDGATAEILAWVNTHPRIKVRAAVDLPSGLGETNAGTVFRADFTYATGIVKTPVVNPANAAFVGRARYLDLGFFETPVAGAETDCRSLLAGDPQAQSLASKLLQPSNPSAGQRVLLSSILAPLAQLRPAQTDKRTYGHLFVVGGSRSYPGAVLMTVQAALRSGVGLLTAFVPSSLVPEYAVQFPEAMWVGMPETAAGGLSLAGRPLLLEKLARASALVIGPGLGAEPETIALVQEIVRAANLPLVIDADALRPEVLAAAQDRRIIVTPHAGEFARIAGGMDLRTLTQTRRLIAVLKGGPTRISDGQTVYLSFFGGPVLARGGSGDLLAGLIGGLLAQGPDDLLLAAGRGVVWHGLAADLLARDKGQVAVQTTQLLDYLQPALRCAEHATT